VRGGEKERRRAQSPAWRKRVALWRYEQIADVVSPATSRGGRAALIQRIGDRPVIWPSGKNEPVPRATVYRWIKLYKKGGIRALEPGIRNDRGKKRARLPDDVVDKAVTLFADDPDISLTFLLALLAADDELRLKARGIDIKRSTLHRRLRTHPLYVQISGAMKRRRRRGRYVPKHAHDMWHVDAKGPVEGHLVSGETFTFHVLTVLDGATRDALAWLVSLRADLRAAVRVFRLAAKRWGVPKLVCLDRASIFDSHAFRGGLADFGAHRVRVRPRNPEVNGKIEAYHRSLGRWFTKRLARQKVVDLEHVQQLLDAIIETLYRDHKHRDLGMSPRAALAGRISTRTVSPQRLDDAFRTKVEKKSHPKTGEVDLPGAKYLVPDDLRGQRLEFLIDPEEIGLPVVVDPRSEKHRALTRAAIRPQDAKNSETIERWAEGHLQALYDHWQGKIRPNAEPGFGLPEIFALLTKSSGRPVPKSDAEAALVHQTYRALGPLPKKATEKAFTEIRRELGVGRPIKIYLDALARRVVRVKTKRGTKK